MDFEKMRETQKLFDANFTTAEKNDRIKKKFFALIVEVGEAANESPETFKYWSSNPVGSTLKNMIRYSKPQEGEGIIVSGDPLLEECVDELHFLLSLGNELEVVIPKNGYAPKAWKDIVHAQLHFVSVISNLYLRWRAGALISELSFQYAMAMDIFLSIVKKLGYTMEELEKAFYEKDKVNHERQANGY